MNVYRHMVCIDASDVVYATSALTTLYAQAEQIFALKDGKPTYPADKIAHGDVICIDFSDGGKSVSALVYRQNEKNGGIVYASAITDEEGVMLTFDEDGIYKSKQKVAGGGGGGDVTLPIDLTDKTAFTATNNNYKICDLFSIIKDDDGILNLFLQKDETNILFFQYDGDQFTVVNSLNLLFSIFTKDIDTQQKGIVFYDDNNEQVFFDTTCKIRIGKTRSDLLGNNIGTDGYVYTNPDGKTIFDGYMEGVSTPLKLISESKISISFLAYYPTIPPSELQTNHYFSLTTNSSGIAVEANPASEATESLSKVRIENTVYSVGGGSAPTNMVTTDTAQTITGVKTFENGLVAYAIGEGAYSKSSNYSLAIGYSAYLSSSDYAITIGANSRVSSDYGVAIGSSSQITGGINGTAIGTSAKVYSRYGVAIGNKAQVASNSDNSIAIGNSSSAMAINSIAIGYDSYEKIVAFVSFDTLSFARTLDLYAPTKIFFRNENIKVSATSTSSYTNGKTLQDYLDEKASLADEQTISGAWTFTNAAGLAVGASPDLTTILGTGITHNGVSFSFPTTGGTFATEEKYDPIIPTTLHGDASTNQVTLYHDASQLSGQTPLQLKTVGGQSLIGSGDIPLAAAQSRTSRAIYTHTISISHSNISYAIKLFTDTDTEITSATALWSALDSSLNAMYIKSENERNIIFDFSKDSSGNITLYYLDASSSMSIEVDTGDLISDNVS